jgi:hypothetical protein
MNSLLSVFLIVIGASFCANASSADQAGSLDITAEPSGATVYLDNTPIGKTDIIIGSIPTGMHTIRLELASYKNVEDTVAVRSGLTTSFSRQPQKDRSQPQAGTGFDNSKGL